MLTVRCTLLRGVFEGGAADDARNPEWPPSWMRLFSALVSVAQPESDDDHVLRALESSTPPEIRASEATSSLLRAYVPTNAIEDPGTHTVLVGRTNGGSPRVWPRTHPKDPVVWYRWPDLELSPDLTEQLTRLARKVPYLGRSTSPAVIEVVEQHGPEHAWLSPGEIDEPGFRFEQTIRSPHPGALDALRDAHRQKFVHGRNGDPWQIGRGVSYGHHASHPDEKVDRGPFEHLVIFRLAPPEGRRGSASLDGRHTARVAHYVRNALMSRVGDGEQAIPEALHGHHQGNARQIAILGLVDVGHNHASGRLLGVGLAVPPLEQQDLVALVGGLPDPGLVMEVAAGPFGTLRLKRMSAFEAVNRRTLRPTRWQRASRVWATATPAVLDRHIKRDSDAEAVIRKSLSYAGLPSPAEIEISRDPFIPGGLGLTPRDTLRRPGDRRSRPYRHLRITFEQPLAGPIVFGAMRNYGLGLCVPVQGTAPEPAQQEATDDT